MVSIYLNDDRDYSEVIEEWVREFIWTMDEDIHDGGGRPGICGAHRQRTAAQARDDGLGAVRLRGHPHVCLPGGQRL